jgi:glycosyltransferase involved in cell wall biosynthesis
LIDRALLLGLQSATLAARGAVALRTAFCARSQPPLPDGPLRVLMVAHYPPSNAGTRHRLLGFVEPLRARGHTVDVAFPTQSARGERLHREWTRAARTEYHLRLLARRCLAVHRAHRYHAVLLHLSDLPHWEYGAPFVARALARRAGRLVLDLDDLPVVRGASEPAPRARAVVAAAHGLTLGNSWLRAAFPERPAWRVPTCVDPGAWSVPDRSTRPLPPVLGWIGTSGNLPALESLSPALAGVQRETGARVHVVCDRPPSLPGVEFRFVPWTLPAETAAVLEFDVGLAPLDDGPMQRAKCGLKALQYMAAALPVVASPVGVLTEMVQEGRNGPLPASLPEQ